MSKGETETHQELPRLGKPGAGLPWPESWIARLLVFRHSKKTPWNVSHSRFKKQNEMIHNIIETLNETQMNTRVLIPRLRGLEDSSRYWSVTMTLDHMTIVAQGMAHIITLLSKNEPIHAVVDTAQVKPRGVISSDEARKKFSEVTASVYEKISTDVADRLSQSKHPHPWFGPLTTHQWLWVLASHQAIHRAQIKEILNRMNH